MIASQYIASVAEFAANQIYLGNSLDVLHGWPAEIISCVISSPPYWALRKYKTRPLIWGGLPGCAHEWSIVDTLRKATPGDVPSPRSILRQNNNGSGTTTLTGGVEKLRANSELRPGEPSAFCTRCGAWRGHLGLEPTPDLYVAHLCDIFDEVRRVLRRDGVCWVNIGDSYGGSGGAGGDWNHGKKASEPKWRQPHINHDRKMTKDGRDDATAVDDYLTPAAAGVPRKSLVMIPERFAAEMVRRGWILRDRIPWLKALTRVQRVDGHLSLTTIGSCMPASVTDRCTSAWEYLYMFTKTNEPTGFLNTRTLHAQATPGPGINGEEGIDWHWAPCGRCGALGMVHDDDEMTAFKKRVEKWAKTRRGKTRKRVDVVFLDDDEMKAVIEAGEKATACPRCEGTRRVKVSFWQSVDYWFERQFVPLKSHVTPRAFGGNKRAGGDNATYSGNPYTGEALLGANMRNAWLIGTSKTKEKHFATFSIDLCIIPVRSSCPREICTRCGLPRYPVVVARGGSIGHSWHAHDGDLEKGQLQDHDIPSEGYERTLAYTSCACGAPTIPGVVLDPFFGTGTAAVAAMMERRRWAGIELSPVYLEFAHKRLASVATETGTSAKKALARKAAEQGMGKLEAFMK